MIKLLLLLHFLQRHNFLKEPKVLHFLNFVSKKERERERRERK